MSFRVLDTMGDINDTNLCFLERFVEGIETDTWRVGEGERVGSIYPRDARISMDPANPGIKLSSLLGNTRRMLIASSEFKAVIEKHCQGLEIEYLPFTLMDHRGRVYSQNYFIINPIGTFDCLDFKKSNILWDSEEPDSIIHIREHVLDREKAKHAPQLFRIARSPRHYIVGLDLAKEMQSHKLTNIFWTRLRYGDEV